MRVLFFSIGRLDFIIREFDFIGFKSSLGFKNFFVDFNE